MLNNHEIGDMNGREKKSTILWWVKKATYQIACIIQPYLCKSVCRCVCLHVHIHECMTKKSWPLVLSLFPQGVSFKETTVDHLKYSESNFTLYFLLSKSAIVENTFPIHNKTSPALSPFSLCLPLGLQCFFSSRKWKNSFKNLWCIAQGALWPPRGVG